MLGPLRLLHLPAAPHQNSRSSGDRVRAQPPSPRRRTGARLPEELRDRLKAEQEVLCGSEGEQPGRFLKLSEVNTATRRRNSVFIPASGFGGFRQALQEFQAIAGVAGEDETSVN